MDKPKFIEIKKLGNSSVANEFQSISTNFSPKDEFVLWRTTNFIFNCYIMNIRLIFFQLLAPIYDWLHFASVGRTVAALRVLNFLGHDKKVLDLGGGTGRLALRIKNMVGSLTVVDASTSMLKVCRRRGLDCHLGLAEQIPFQKNYFDSVVIVDAWHHFPEPESALREISRVLKPGGRIFIEEVNPSSIFGWLLKSVENILLMRSRFYHPADLSALMTRHFSAVEIVKSNPRFYYVIGTKH